MPKVQFVNEHREVEVDAGRLISEIAEELGIAVCREEFVWTEVGGWGQGGTLYWQLFDKSGQALELHGSSEGLPAWSFAAAIALPNGQFAVLY
jgi:hypothetical protein